MMKQEFEKRIGLVITSEEYAVIEASYMGLPESVDKDKFVKIWLREGGIQDLFDKRAVTIQSLKAHVSQLKEENREYLADMNKNSSMVIQLRMKVKELEEKISAINALAIA